MDSIDGLPELDTSALTFANDPLARIDPRGDGSDVERVAKQLEGVFMSMLVKTMRQSMSEDGIFGDGTAGDVYGGFFDRMLGERLAERSGLGIEELVVRAVAERADRREGSEGNLEGAVEEIER